DAVDRGRRRAGLRRRIDANRLSDHAVMPGDQLAAGVEARLDVVRRHRTEFSTADVVLAAPDELDRLADRPRDPPRVDDHLLLAAAAETSAQNMLVQRDLAGLSPKHAGDLTNEVGRSLRAGPDLGGLAVRADGGSRAQRLHLRVIDVTRAVFAAEH